MLVGLRLVDFRNSRLQSYGTDATEKKQLSTTNVSSLQFNKSSFRAISWHTYAPGR